jgi:spore coat polysaccharide biosynthesis protein SpsF
MTSNSEQEKFWATTYANDYIKKNAEFDNKLGAEAWQKMLQKIQTGSVANYLECGCNIGRNITQIKLILPSARPSIIEISEPAFKFVTTHHSLVNAYNGPILNSDFEEDSYDLVFTMGVLIHINPDQLLEHMKKMFRYSRKYILIGEYFNRTPVSLEYQGEKEKLFKRDFGKLFIENFDVRLVDYGFHWGHIFDPAGFDDVTWWLFEKR